MEENGATTRRFEGTGFLALEGRGRRKLAGVGGGAGREGRSRRRGKLRVDLAWCVCVCVGGGLCLWVAWKRGCSARRLR